MSEKALYVDPSSTPSPSDHTERLSGRGNTAETHEKTQLALVRLFGRAEDLEKQHRTMKADLDALTKDLKALGVTPGEPVTVEKLAINRDAIMKAMDVLKGGRLKVKEFQRGMGYFDTQELSRVRKALIAAEVTVEIGEGSVVYVALSAEFAVLEAADA